MLKKISNIKTEDDSEPKFYFEAKQTENVVQYAKI